MGGSPSHGPANHITILAIGVCSHCVKVRDYKALGIQLYYAIKVEYHVNDNLFKNSEKIAYVGQRLMYATMKKNNTLPC